MKKVLSSVLVSLVTFTVAASAQAQSAAPNAQQTGAQQAWRPAVAQDGMRLRAGVDLGAGLGIVNSFSPYRMAMTQAVAINLRVGVQFNNTWALMGQFGFNPVFGAAVLMPTSILAEVGNRYIGFAFGPSLTPVLIPQAEMLVRPGATLRLTGYLGSTAPARRFSFTYGAESTTAILPNGVISTVVGLVGFEMH
ncbi:MAG: hypothetical protein JNK05_30755 [Myxococcales bacterium]|nr:hypothetical protein [Myxococcales bacterium]